MQKNLKNIFGTHHGLDDKSVDYLTKALAKNNLPGFDYLEFKQSLIALAKMGMDEATAMKSAFATASTVGLTKDKLMKTAQHYKQILATEKTQFDEALGNQLNKRVNSKRQEVEKLKVQIGKWKEQVSKLETQIAQSQNTIDHADENIRAEMQKIESTKTNFEQAYQTIENQIDKDVEDVDLYL
ncbi:MAG: putative nucleic acid-binding Zn-ribbon protein [Paraglaciecola sp.]|jgi:predicted  nucleic acid-binding Zn-ribbon protein